MLLLIVGISRFIAADEAVAQSKQNDPLRLVPQNTIALFHCSQPKQAVDQILSYVDRLELTKFDEVQEEIKRVPYKVVKAANGDVAVEVEVDGKPIADSSAMLNLVAAALPGKPAALKLIRAKYLTPAVGLNKIKGQPFKISEIESAVEALLSQGRN